MCPELRNFIFSEERFEREITDPEGGGESGGTGASPLQLQPASRKYAPFPLIAFKIQIQYGCVPNQPY